MFNKLKQFQDLRKQAKTLQNKLSEEIVEVTKGGFKIVMDGNQEIKSLEVDSNYLDPSKKESMEKEIISLVSDAVKKVQRKMAQKMMKDGSFKDLNLPGFGG